jgi:phytoene/squalene synthetase
MHICGEIKVNAKALEEFCVALQLLQAIQECSDDYVNHERVYLPLDWFALAGANVKDLAASECSASLRLVLDRGLDHCQSLLKKSRTLLSSIALRRLRLEVALIHGLAVKLCARLRKKDPLQSRVKINPASKAASMIALVVQL